MEGLCSNCRQHAYLYKHHIVPRSAGGTDNPGNLVTLCHQCHDAVHACDKGDIRKLVKMGLERAKREGRIIGRPQTVSSADLDAAVQLVKQGSSLRKAAKATGISHSRIRYELLKRKEVV